MFFGDQGDQGLLVSRELECNKEEGAEGGEYSGEGISAVKWSSLLDIIAVLGDL